MRKNNDNDIRSEAKEVSWRKRFRVKGHGTCWPTNLLFSNSLSQLWKIKEEELLSLLNIDQICVVISLKDAFEVGKQ